MKKHLAVMTLVFLCLPLMAQTSAEHQSLEHFIINYFEHAQGAFSSMGLPAVNHCEQNPGMIRTEAEKLPKSGPHLWETCSFEELTFDCHIFNHNDPAIFLGGSASVLGALPTNILRPFFSRSTPIENVSQVSHDMEQGVSLEQILSRLKIKDNTPASSQLPRLQVLSKLYFDEQKNFSGEEQIRKKEVRILTHDPRCDLNPFFLNVDQEKDLLFLCPALSVLPNVLVASLFAQEIFKQASSHQQEQALAAFKPLPPNVNASSAYQKWRLIQNLEHQGIHHLIAPELRLLAFYPEALYGCAYQEQGSNQNAAGEWKKQINAQAKLSYLSSSLQCPGASEK